LVEILFCAAILSVATLTLWAVLTIFSAILTAVHDGFHTQSSMDLSPIVMTEACEVSRAVLIRLAGGLLVCLFYLGVVHPWIAHILETGNAITMVFAVTIIDTGCEWSSLDCSLSLLVEAGQGFPNPIHRG